MFFLLTSLAIAMMITSCQGTALRSSTRFELERYKHRNDVLLEVLTNEGCSALSEYNRSRRSLNTPELELEIEKVVFNELIEKLAECRVTTNPPTTTPTTTTTTATTTTTPTTTTVLPQPTECQSAINLTEYWRKDYFGRSIKPRNNDVNCDDRDMKASGRPWFRFSGAAGSRLIDHCVISKTGGHESCGTHIAFWSNTTMPHQIGVVTSIQIYGSWSSGCTQFSATGSVVRCSEKTNDFVYKYLGNVICSSGFCGMD